MKGRLAQLEPHLRPGLGTALRHAGAEIASIRSHRKLILVLTDGEPSDIDVVDPRDLVEDARRAVLGLRSRGSTFSVSRLIRRVPALALLFSAAASTCPCVVWKICRPGSPNFISALRGVELLPVISAGAPAASRAATAKARAKAASSPRANAPPFAARIRPPMPAPFGSFDMPAMQPSAARQLSRTSAIATLATPSPTTRACRRHEKVRAAMPARHQFTGERTAVGEKNSARGVAHDDGIAVAIEWTARPSGSCCASPSIRIAHPPGAKSDVGRAAILGTRKTAPTDRASWPAKRRHRLRCGCFAMAPRWCV